MQLTWIDRKFSWKNTYKLFLVHSWSNILYVCSPSRHKVNLISPATLTSATENLIVTMQKPFLKSDLYNYR